ncbi:MAG: THUMP domain-containing protein [Gemmatimonadetes bacterium]|nr:THUMP domain-containing protein [Gemmatimonadota bacterium]
MTPGFEPVVARELATLGIAPRDPEAGGVAFRADAANLFRANLHLRAASRVLVRVAAFSAKSFAELERRAKVVPWKAYARPDARITFRVTCRKSRLYHSDAVAERLAKSVLAQLPGVRIVGVGDDAVAPDEDDSIGGPAGGPADGAPPQLFVVRFEHDECTISADSSGELLHRRGYRLATAKAPIRETIAAGVLLALAYDGTVPLIDPMCGSGTIAIEAALIARNIAPGMGRSFACETWPGFNIGLARQVRAAARTAQRPSAPAAIIASDRDAGAIAAAESNAERAGVTGDVTIVQRALSAIEPPPGSGLLVANPPYGARVGDSDALRNLYAQFGNVARAKLPGWRVALVSADRSLDAQTKLRFADEVRFSNGGIKVRLVATPPLSK